jgi:uncharacterized protein
MLSLKRPLYAILWLCLFSAGLFSIAGTALALYAHVSGLTTKAVGAMMSNLVEYRLNSIMLPLFIIVMFASMKGWLPGTRPEPKLIDNSEQPPHCGFSDALALVVYLVLIQTGLGFLQGAVCESIGIPALARMPVAHCMLGGMSSILFVLIALHCFRTPAADLLHFSKADYPVFPLLLFIIAGGALIGSEIDNMQRTLLWYPDIQRKLMDDMLNQGFLSLFLLGIIAPVAEELVFRGIVLKSFLQKHSAVKAIILSAIVFSCAHLDPLQMLPAFGSGLLLGWLYYETGNLWICIAVHSALNLLSFIAFHDLLPFRLTGFTGPSFEKYQFQPLWLDVLAIFLLAAGIAAVRVVVRRNDSAEVNY